MKKAIAFTILLASLASCSDSDTYQEIETPPGTGTPPPTTEPAAKLTYTKNVKSIIDANCITCHQTGKAAAFRPLTTYAQVKEAVQSAGLLNRIQLQNGEQGIMPQGGRMSQANIDIIKKWNTDGLLEN
ncbi:c-type cytochrome [Flavobacterium aestuarii]|uniref:c-type cytochrome n=1 Tax=Flavobacterium aestuarii TaxID=3149227 RepID=UPI0032B5A8C2